MALGAAGSDVARLVLQQALRLAGAGLTLGLIGSFAATRLLTSMLFEVQTTDAPTYAGVSALVGLVALLASYIPARRAAKVDPMAVLR
jgi:putative ABC transport system permease protein